VDWIYLTSNKDQWRALLDSSGTFGFLYVYKRLDSLGQPRTLLSEARAHAPWSDQSIFFFPSLGLRLDKSLFCQYFFLCNMI
jgi:hypothetical protein